MKTGEFFKTYYLIDRIGHGGMSVVHLAFDVRTKQFVALKTLFSDLSCEADYQNRFSREIAVYRKLNHPNIVSLIEADTSGPVNYVALEYVKGRSLARVIEEFGSNCPLPEALRIMEGLTNALFHAHSKGIIHRDVQPNNIIITPDGTVKLIDFGISYADDRLLETQTGTIMGTFVYCSPEQNQGKRVDERSDLYSLGLIFYELLTGRRAIKGETLMEITEFQLRQSIPPVKNFRFEIPDALNDIVMRLLERWPENRYKYARNLIDELIQMKVSSTYDDLDLLFGDEYEVKLDTAHKAFINRRFETAVKLVADVLKARPDNASAHFLNARIFSKLDDENRAAEQYRKALDLIDEDCPDYRIEYALCLYRLGRDDAAMAQCDMVLAIDKSNRLALGLRTMLEGLKRGSLRIDPVSKHLTPSSPLVVADHHRGSSPFDRDLDLIERFGILNERVDALDPDLAQGLSTILAGLGEVYNGTFLQALKMLPLALALLITAFILLLSPPVFRLDVDSFLQEHFFHTFVEQARQEDLEGRVNKVFTGYIRLGFMLMSIPLFLFYCYLVLRSRSQSLSFHHRRHLYGRIVNIFRDDLLELQVPADQEVSPGDDFAIVENNPFSSGRCKRDVLGVATVLMTGHSWAVCSFTQHELPRPAPSAGDIALPGDIIRAACLPCDEVFPCYPHLERAASAYWTRRIGCEFPD